MNPPDADQPNARRRVQVTAADLPLHCPMPGKRLWDSHPKVYLPVAPGAELACPYCGTVYVFATAQKTQKTQKTKKPPQKPSKKSR